MRKYSTSEKRGMEVWTARFYRRAAGRITKREATKIGRLYGVDLHWKYMSVSGDKLAARTTNDMVRRWEEWGAFFRTSPGEMRRSVDYHFCWYGPNSGIWPGMKLKFAPSDTGGGWVIDPAFSG